LIFLKKIPLFSIIVLVSITGSVFANCYPGNALEFDGIDDYVDLPQNNPIWLPQENFTLLLWVYFERDLTNLMNNEKLLDLNHGESADPANELGYGIMRLNTGEVWFRLTTITNTDEDLATDDILYKDRWYHIAAIRNGTSQEVYINGQLSKSRTCSPDPVKFFGGYDDDKVSIGRSTNFGTPELHLKGMIDEVAIFDRALSAEEVAQLYCCDGCVSDLSPLAYWNFDEDRGQVTYDVSDNGMDGHLGNDPCNFDYSDPVRVESGVPINNFYIDDNYPDDPCHGIPGALVGDPCFSDPLENGTICHPFDSIQKAIDKAANQIRGCYPKIIASDGVYSGIGNYDIDTLGLAVTIKSENGPKNCIIDCNSLGRGFIVQNGEDLDTVIDGFTIIDGYAAECAGAIDCNNGSPTINNCLIEGNYAGWSGGAIFCQDSNAQINNCIITDNFCEASGAGICGVRGFPVIKNCLITNNDGYFSGGASSVYDCNMTIINCTIADNIASHPYLSTGGVYCWQGDVNIVNTIIWDNNSPGSEQIEFFMGNEACKVTYSDIQIEDSNLVWVGTGNLNDDPCFAAPEFGDYHLKSTAGRWAQILDSAADLNNDDIVNQLDLGIFVENWLYTGEETYLDLYRATSIDFRDFDVFADNWHSVGQNKADFSENNHVDWADLGIFAEYWLDTGREIPVDLYYEASIDFKDYAVLALNWLHTGWVYSDTETSLCIDAGDPNCDCTLEPQPNGDRINMGTYGNTEYASKSPYTEAK